MDEAEIDGDAPPHEGAHQDHRDELGVADAPGEVGEEEIREPKFGRRPVLPTKAEVDEHVLLHLHYRSWCRHCRAGKGRLAPHLVEPPDREKLGPRRAEANAYDPECTNDQKTYYGDNVMKGAKTSLAAGVPRVGTQDVQAHVPMRGREFDPRRIYIKPADFDRHGHT